MGQRLALTPNDFSPSGTTMPRLKCVFNFDDIGDRVVDCRARLVVYDRDLYFATALGRSEGYDPFMKSGVKVQMNLGAGPDPMNPPLGAGTGVLAIINGIIRRTKGTKGWCFRPTTTATNTGTTKITIPVDMPDDYFNLTSAFEIAYLADDFPCAPTRYLIFRLINLGRSFGGQDMGEVLACNINPDHNPGANGPVVSWGAVTFHVAAADADHPSDIGGDGGKSDMKPPQAASRVLDPDLTGFYEALPFDENGNVVNDFTYDPALMVQINQAGNSIVGWFSPPATNLGAKPGSPPAAIPTVPGCFSSYAAPGPNGRSCEYFLQSGGQPSRNVIDPDSPPGPLSALTLRVAPGPQDDVALELDMVFSTALTSGGAPQQGTLRVRRTSLATRIPYYFIGPVLDDADKNDPRVVEFAREVVQEQLEILPMTFWDRLAGAVMTKLLPPVQAWADAGGQSSDKALARGKASDALLSLIPAPLYGEESPTRDRVVAANVRALLAIIDLQLENAQTQSALRWLQTMVDDKTTEVISVQPGLTPADIYAGNYIEKGFKKFQIMPGGEFVYTIHSFSIGGATPIVMFVGAYGFFMTVSKERIVKDASGVEKRERIDGPGWDQVVLFEGAIAQVGVGASIDLKKVKAVQTGLADVPGEIEFHTCVDIPSQSDFNGARFTVHALKIGTVGAVVGKGAIINSAFVQFTLENGVALDATVESNMTVKVGFDWDKVQSKIEKKQPRSVSDLKSLARDIAMPEVSLLQYVHSAGKLLLRDRDLGKAPTIAASVQKQRQQARRTRTTLFDVDSATLDPATRGWMEAQLAIDRALFEATGGSGIAEGYASPEATEDHNQKLSESRAQAVVQAVKDAFGSTLAIPIQATGYGETPATEPNGTLLNPPDTPSQIASLSSDDRNRLFIEKKLHWPSWRRVDLTVNNALVVTVMGRGARPD